MSVGEWNGDDGDALPFPVNGGGLGLGLGLVLVLGFRLHISHLFRMWHARGPHFASYF